MTEFWEAAFADKQEMWGYTPAQTAVAAKDLFIAEKIKTVLIPGFGYGRNAEIFQRNGMQVTGIEISKSAIEIAERHFDSPIIVHHGSVSGMPFDSHEYDGIYCYALIHLLSSEHRSKLISDCYAQLKPGGTMIFVTISKADPVYGLGSELEPDTFERFPGLTLYFYDEDSVNRDFGPYGLTDVAAIDEPNTHEGDHPPHSFLVITCRKPA